MLVEGCRLRVYECIEISCDITAVGKDPSLDSKEGSNFNLDNVGKVESSKTVAM